MGAEDEDEPREKRDQWIPKIRASASELAAIEARRERAGLPLSTYVRQMAIAGAIIQRQPLADRELIRHLAARGNNLNQLARKANIRGELDADLTDRLEGLISTIEALIDELVS